MRKRIALVDADGILYASALKGETLCDGKQLQLLDIDYIYKDCLERIETQVKWTGANDAFICLSDRRNFRYDILSTYKGNRKQSLRPIMLDELRAMVIELAPYRVKLIPGLEADDVCGIAQGQLQRHGIDPVIVSPDKDMLTIPGYVMTPKPGSSKKPELVNNSEEAADRWHMYQTLIGDVTDNYKGCPSCGPVTAERLLKEFDGQSPALRWAAIVDLFVEKGATPEDALQQAQVSRILRVTDWDPVKKEPILWQPPIG